MEIPGATFITVTSSNSSPSVEEDGAVISVENFSNRHPQTSREVRAETPNLIFANASMQSQHKRRSEIKALRGSVASNRNTQSLESHMLNEIEEVEEEDIECKDSQDEDIIAVNSPSHLPNASGENNYYLHGLQSVSTTLVGEEECRRESLEDEVSAALEWFRSTFNKIGKNGRISLGDFKQAARECDVRSSDIVLYYKIIHLLLFQGFAERLFKLFDTDNSSSVSLQELVGGMGRLTT